jgi:hypothetical protein
MSLSFILKSLRITVSGLLCIAVLVFPAAIVARICGAAGGANVGLFPC